MAEEGDRGTRKLSRIRPQPPVIIVDFTAEGAAKFDEVLARLERSLDLFSGRAAFPSSLNVTIEGSEPITIDAPSLLISRLEGTNRYVFPYPQPDLPDAEPHDVERAQAAVGDEPTIAFCGAGRGRLMRDFGLGGDHLARAYPGLHAQTDEPIINIEFQFRRGRGFFGEKDD